MPLVPEVADRDARLQPHRRDSLGGVRRLLGAGAARPHRGHRGASSSSPPTAAGAAASAIELKAATDKALRGGCPSVKHVIVLKRTGKPVTMKAKRDLWWHDVIEGQSPACEPEWVDAEHPLFLLYTSGSTGKPKGIQHSTGGYLLGRQAHDAVGVRPARRGRVLVHGGRRLGDRPQLRRLRTARRRRHRGAVRGRADWCRTAGASGRTARRTASRCSTPRRPRSAR